MDTICGYGQSALWIVGIQNTRKLYAQRIPPADEVISGKFGAIAIPTLIARFMGPTWGPSGAERTQVGPMLAPWILLSGYTTSLPSRRRHPAHGHSSDGTELDFASMENAVTTSVSGLVSVILILIDEMNMAWEVVIGEENNGNRPS